MSKVADILEKLLDLRPYEIELQHDHPRISPLAWTLLAGGMIALAAAALACWPVWRENQELESKATALEGQLASLGGGAAADAGSHARSGKSGPGSELAEADDLVGNLHRPWHELFDQIEAAVAAENSTVHLIQFSVEPRFATVQLVVEGRDLGALVRFAQRLSGGNPIASMTLTHHEARDALGAHVISASLQGQLVGGDAASGGGAR